ncbi:PAAR domain-containing protein [Paraburkholderia sp.]|uniref:PAAR domain-containing protein n=1 Tax=Paraburkholderia sp. TaxID=1926495 RepID=UPI00286ECE63|nr:PAAR domain-containing protein [Paraburkholderia sp.]
MKDTHGRDMARLGDTTDHGGKVIQAAGDLTHMGIQVALDGHLVMCPKCGGPFPIIALGQRTHAGTRVAYLGDKTACGATLVRA